MIVTTYFRKPDFSPELPSKIVIKDRARLWQSLHEDDRLSWTGVGYDQPHAITIFCADHQLSSEQFNEHYVLAREETQ